MVIVSTHLPDTVCHYVGGNKFAAFNVAVFEELTLDYGIYSLQESLKKLPNMYLEFPLLSAG